MSETKAAGADAVGVECIIPILNVASLTASVAFYTGVLGFQTDWDAASMASVSRDGRAIMLCQQGQGQAGTWVWIGVEDIEPLYADFVAKGASIRLKPTNFSFAYEMQVEDPDGHVLRFGSDPKTDCPDGGITDRHSRTSVRSMAGSMADDESPADSIARAAAAQRPLSDDEFLARLQSLPTLADEDDPAWDSNEYWQRVAYPYLAFADVAAERKLRRAVRPLLERACYGDPGEIMRGLRHPLEAIFNPNWAGLADEYLAVARSDRPGTRMWAIAGLAVVDDPRAAPTFEASLREDPPDISGYAKIGLKRLARRGPAAT